MSKSPTELSELEDGELADQSSVTVQNKSSEVILAGQSPIGSHNKQLEKGDTAGQSSVGNQNKNNTATRTPANSENSETGPSPHRNSISTMSPTYSEIIQIPGDSNIAVNKKRQKKVARRERQHQERDTNRQRQPSYTKRTLKGCIPEKGVTLYVEHIQMCLDDTDDDIVKMVKVYGQTHSVRVMNGYVIHNRVCTDIVGCKITVPASHVEKVMLEDFWGQDITCRRWEDRRPRRKTQTNPRGDNRANGLERDQHARSYSGQRSTDNGRRQGHGSYDYHGETDNRNASYQREFNHGPWDAKDYDQDRDASRWGPGDDDKYWEHYDDRDDWCDEYHNERDY